MERMLISNMHPTFIFEHILLAFYICLILKIGCGCEILTMIHHIVSLAITSMDKSWMHKSRLSKDYELRVENFIKFGFSNANNGFIRCPCLKCGNCEKQSRNGIQDHLYVNGIDESYKIWFWHGEELPKSSWCGESSRYDT